MRQIAQSLSSKNASIVSLIKYRKDHIQIGMSTAYFHRISTCSFDNDSSYPLRDERLSAASRTPVTAIEDHSVHILKIIVVILVVLTRWSSFNVSRSTPFGRPLFKVLLDFVNTLSRAPWR